AEYAPEAMELMAPYTDAYRLNGKLYGFPILKNWVTNGYICMRKDILEELGMLELGQNLDNLDDYEKILAAVHDNYTATTGLYAISKEAGRSVTPSNLWNGRKFSDVELYENAGDSTGTVMILSDGNNKVTWAQDDPRTEEKLTWVKKWRDNGWVWPDSALTDTHGDELMKQGVSFSVLTGSEIGIEVTKGANIGKEVVCPKYYTGMISTSGVQTWGMGIPVTAEEPEAGAYFMNILFTDPVVMNLITWGVEGVDYDLVDGQVQTREGMYYESDFIMGNNLLLKPIYGNGPNHYENVAADIAAAKNSEYLGFALDLNPLQDYIANISAVNDQYTPDLYTGNYTPEKFASYKAALETGGVHDYLDAVQKQLDAWLASR
ncbi:MAG: ABC transporter substrate-binding protein, partial [Oscillospiraceae bacterium]|nr:ABC transporter substrate-binding protein [Oscillospiraceae bacterium]